MNKFVKTLSQSNSKIKEARAKIIAADAQFAQENIVRNLETEKRKLDGKLLSLTDLHPDSELSLRVVRKDFDAEQLFQDIQNTKVDLANKTVELQLANETSKEWFGEEEEVTDEKN